MSKLTEFLKLSGQVKKMMLEAYLYSAKYRFIIMHKEFKEYCEDIGTFQYETPKIRISDQIIADTEWAVNAACKRATWDSKCLDRALTAKKILNKRGYPCTMYMGVRMDEKNQLTAHAWLRCGTNWVSGGNGDGYAITGIYGDKTELLKKTFSADYRFDDNLEVTSTSQPTDSPVITNICDWFSSQNIQVLLLPERGEDCCRLLVKEKDFSDALSILKEHHAVEGSRNVNPSAGKAILLSGQEICLLTKCDLEYNEKFGNLWKRRKTYQVGHSSISTLSDLDEITDLFRYLSTDEKASKLVRKRIEFIVKEQLIPLDLLYNHMQSRNMKHELIQFLTDFYIHKGYCLKPYSCQFLFIKVNKETIELAYDKTIDI